MWRKKHFGDKAHELDSQLLLSTQLKTVAGLSIDSDLSQKLGKVLLDENQTSSISSYYVEITRKKYQVVILLHGFCSCS